MVMREPRMSWVMLAVMVVMRQEADWRSAALWTAAHRETGERATWYEQERGMDGTGEREYIICPHGDWDQLALCTS